MKKACAVLFASGIALCAAPAAQAFAPSVWPKMPAEDAVLHKAADSGINIVRMPPRPGIGQPSAAAAAVQETPARTQPTQPQGRLLKLTARAGSQSNDPQKGWLGVNMEPLELPLALSLGLPNGEGVLLLPGKGLEQSRLICYMRDQRAVNEFVTLFGQFDQNAAPIFRIRYAPHKPFFCQPVDAIGHRSRCHHHRAKKFGGRESIRCSGTAQGRQHIEAPVVQAELRKYRLQFLLHDER